MVRRKLLLMLGPVVATTLVVAIVAASFLEGTLTELQQIVASLQAFGETHTVLAEQSLAVELALRQHPPQTTLPGGVPLQKQLDAIDEGLRSIALDAARDADAGAALAQAGKQLALLRAATAPSQTDPQLNPEEAIRLAGALRQSLSKTSQAAQARVLTLQRGVAARLRVILFGMTVAFIVLINLSLFAILRASKVFIDPVEELVQATRTLATGELSARVSERRADEFGELARAFNDMAINLQHQESKRLETMRQAALAVNHELNNAIHILSLQVDTLARTSGDAQSMSEPLDRIRKALARITKTLDSLKRVRRIVLTDYVAGVSMLDIERSSRAPTATSEVEPGVRGLRSE